MNSIQCRKVISAPELLLRIEGMPGFVKPGLSLESPREDLIGTKREVLKEEIQNLVFVFRFGVPDKDGCA